MGVNAGRLTLVFICKTWSGLLCLVGLGYNMDQVMGGFVCGIGFRYWIFINNRSIWFV